MDEIIEMMETLLDEYGNQDKQLNRMHATLVVLEYGYNSLRQQLSGAECSVSQVLELSRSIADELTQGVESKLEEVTSCIDGAESTLESVKSTTHPCGEGDWKLVVDEDYSEDGGDECRGGWVPFTEQGSGRWFCRAASAGTNNCDSAFFDVNREYTKVCGKIVGYGFGLNEGFSAGTVAIGIDDVYVDGLSLTHGSITRTHIWTFAIGIAEVAGAADANFVCPCHPLFADDDITIPTDVNGDYFCESGLESVSADPPIYYLDDPLWDGRQCHEMCCNSSPYFVKALDNPTGDQLELRICNRDDRIRGNNIVEKIKIFVQ